MKVKHIDLKHTYHFSSLSVPLQTHAHAVSLIFGAQASGKTAIVKNIYQALTWYAARLKDLRSAGVVMLDQDVCLERSSSQIDITIEFPTDIGQMPIASDLSDTDDSANNQTQYCRWQLTKQLNPQALSISRVDTTALEQAVKLYQSAIQRDPLQGLPMIAYYPSERFINEINLLSKNNPTVFHTQSAYELAAIPFSTFGRFFEWLREITDIENAHTAQAFQDFLAQANQALEADEHAETAPALMLNQNQILSPHLNALREALHQVLPDIEDIYLHYHPKLQLMVVYQQQHVPFLQLSSSLKVWIAMIGDIVRRLCILNPNSLFPCQEGDGVLLIDQIDLGLDADMLHSILDRLHRTFPSLQIIATAQQRELLENSSEFQYLSLNNKKLEPIHQRANWLGFEQFYQNLAEQTVADAGIHNTADTEDLAQVSKAQALFEQIQQLSPHEQQALQQLLQSGDDSNLSLISS